MKSESQDAAKSISVAAGLIRDELGRILLAQRPPGTHLAGTWEFPGGKCDPGERPDQALVRELDEELGVRVDSASPLLALTHAYPERTIRLILFEVTALRGEPRGCEGQALRWVPADELATLDMPPADRPIITALGLQPHYAITPDPVRVGGPDAVLAWARASLAAGHRLFQLRAHALEPDQLASLGRRLGQLVRSHDARWLLNGPAELALALDADGVHLSARALMACTRRPVPRDRVVIASCHDRVELERAGELGADLVCLSPVAETASHPAAQPLGWAGLESLCVHSPLPVFALGGLGPSDLHRARRHGAFGVAGISGFGGGE
jgi:8-oxo-dGTP diphosphatase